MVTASARVRVVELLAALSLATDLATYQPMGHGLNTSLWATALARELGFTDERVRSTQLVALLRFIGCTSDASETGRQTGTHESAHYREMAPVLMGSTPGLLRGLATTVGGGQPIHRRIGAFVATLTDPDGLTAHCEVGAMLARRLGCSDDVVLALGHAYERWDGKGQPDGLAGDAVPPEIRVAVVARDIDVFTRRGDDVAAVLRKRSGKAYDPAVVAAFERLGTKTPEGDWDAVLAGEPEPIAYVGDLDRAVEAIADFADIKSPWTRSHSPSVAELAATAGASAGLDSDDVTQLRRAALVHDLGRVGIENTIWDKAGPLDVGEWEKVRLHSYLTERILSRCSVLAPLAELAACHHERLDGSGYHRALSSQQIPAGQRILAAADVMAALVADRPHRPALSLADATETMRLAVEGGQLDGEAVSLVVAAAGGRPPVQARPDLPGGLTEREAEVLTLLARGLTNRRIAETLFISPKTVGSHIEHIYLKAGVSTRAAATMFAMENRLLG